MHTVCFSPIASFIFSRHMVDLSLHRLPLPHVNCRHGLGTMNYANGDVFEGQWANDQKHGNGTHYYHAKGRRFDGIWQTDTPKCGTYSEIKPAVAGTAGALPQLELVDAAGVAAAARGEVLAEL